MAWPGERSETERWRALEAPFSEGILAASFCGAEWKNLCALFIFFVAFWGIFLYF